MSTLKINLTENEKKNKTQELFSLHIVVPFRDFA